MMNNLTIELCNHILNIRVNELSTKVIDRTKKHILDYYSSCFAGYFINESFNKANLDVYLHMGGVEEARVLFSDHRIPAPNAAYINAIYAHGADMDDGNSKSAGHIGTHIMPVVFALAEKYRCTWNDVLKAINIGYDVFNIVAGRAQPSLYKKGFHSTSVAGVIACAAAATEIMKLPYMQIYSAISLAAVQASGLIIIDESGQSCKPINPANAAKTGLISAMLAQKDIVTPRNPLESKKGWFNGFSNEKDFDYPIEEAEKYSILDCYLKLYPTCRHTHSCIEAGKALHAQVGDFDKIDKISIHIYENAIKSAGGIFFPQSSEEAKFSIAYATVVALRNGDFMLENIQNIVDDSQITSLLNKVEIIQDDSTFNAVKMERGCNICVYIKNGQKISRVIRYPRGEFGETLDWEELYTKLRMCSFGKLNETELLCLGKKIKEIDIEDIFNPVDEIFRGI